MTSSSPSLSKWEVIMENQDFEEDGQARRRQERGSMLAVESMRSATSRKPAGRPRRGQDKISLFWQVFGGTILSIVALVILTAYNQLSSTQTELRHDLSQVQVDLVKKDDLSTRLTVMWNSIKELQTTSTSLAGLNEHARVLDQSVDTQFKTAEQRRQDLERKIEELNQRLQTLAERLAVVEGGQRAVKTVVEPLNDKR
jgi:hypothetical protein